MNSIAELNYTDRDLWLDLIDTELDEIGECMSSDGQDLAKKSMDINLRRVIEQLETARKTERQKHIK